MLRLTLAAAPVDAASFRRPLARCELAHCRGTCCAEGVWLNPEVASVVEKLARRYPVELAALGLDLDQPLVEIDETPGETPAARTRRRPHPFHALVADYPFHFPDTRCALLTDDARCALQVVAELEGRHPWHYKPPACWLHPISAARDAIRLHDALGDPYPGGFTSATHCGRTAACGRPAAEVLAPELAFLGELLERDLLAELEPSPRSGQARGAGDAGRPDAAAPSHARPDPP